MHDCSGDGGGGVTQTSGMPVSFSMENASPSVFTITAASKFCPVKSTCTVRCAGYRTNMHLSDY